jgi:hypothetical protein
MIVILFFLVSFGRGNKTAYFDNAEYAMRETIPTAESIYGVALDDILHFGGYDWRVLDVHDGRALILSDRIITRQRYCSRYAIWETSEIREWLNGSFYENTFSAEESVRIAESRIANNDNPWFETPGGADTTDKIFLLSVEEVVKYFGDSGRLGGYRPPGVMSVDDQYNFARIAYDFDGEAIWWWLRSPGFFPHVAAGVNANGRLRWTVLVSTFPPTGRAFALLCGCILNRKREVNNHAEKRLL